MSEMTQHDAEQEQLDAAVGLAAVVVLAFALDRVVLAAADRGEGRVDVQEPARVG